MHAEETRLQGPLKHLDRVTGMKFSHIVFIIVTLTQGSSSSEVD